MRKLAKKDDNHNKIVRELQQLGATVFSTHKVGDGFPDIVVGFRGRNYLFEIKKDTKSKLTDCEKNFHLFWKGQVDIITCFDDAFKILMGG
jgi:hypothetical protein